MHHRRTPGSTPSAAPLQTIDGVVARLRPAIDDVGVDRCAVDADDDLRRRAASLADAQRMRDAIVLVLGLLGDLDELSPDETDLAIFQATAAHFQDIADFAASGSLAAHRAAGRGEYR